MCFFYEHIPCNINILESKIQILVHLVHSLLIFGTSACPVSLDVKLLLIINLKE